LQSAHEGDTCWFANVCSNKPWKIGPSCFDQRRSYMRCAPRIFLPQATPMPSFEVACAGTLEGQAILHQNQVRILKGQATSIFRQIGVFPKLCRSQLPAFERASKTGSRVVGAPQARERPVQAILASSIVHVSASINGSHSSTRSF
jgi:hypothetical protein